MSWRRPAVVAALALLGVSGCQGQTTIATGTYTGSTDAKAPVTVVVDGGITLDGLAMRQDKDGSFVGVKDRRLRMKCRPRNGGEELSCDITRHGQAETDLLMRL